MSVGVFMTLVSMVGSITYRNDDEDDDDDGDGRGNRVLVSILLTTILGVLFLGFVCMIQMTVVYIYRKYHLEYGTQNRDVSSY